MSGINPRGHASHVVSFLDSCGCVRRNYPLVRVLDGRLPGIILTVVAGGVSIRNPLEIAGTDKP
jgi:hypothetical protein